MCFERRSTVTYQRKAEYRILREVLHASSLYAKVLVSNCMVLSPFSCATFSPLQQFWFFKSASEVEIEGKIQKQTLRG